MDWQSAHTSCNVTKREQMKALGDYKFQRLTHELTVVGRVSLLSSFKYMTKL